MVRQHEGVRSESKCKRFGLGLSGVITRWLLFLFGVGASQPRFLFGVAILCREFWGEIWSGVDTTRQSTAGKPGFPAFLCNLDDEPKRG